MLQGVLIDEAIELLCQLAGDFGRSTGARAIHETLGSLIGKAMHPFPQGGIGKLERVGDVLDAPSFHDGAYSLGAAKDACLFGLFQEGVQGRERIIRKGQFEGPHMRVSSNKLLQKYDHPTSHYVVTLLSAQNLSGSNFPEAA